MRTALTLWRLPSRVTIALVVFALLVWVAAWMLAHRAAGQLIDSLRWFGDAEYSSVSVGLGGTVEYRGFRLRSSDPLAGEVFSARNVQLQTPGLHWLVWHGVVGGASTGGLADTMGAAQLARVEQSGGVPRAFPAASRLGLRIDGLVAGPGLARNGDLRWIGLVSAAPMDAEGCDGRSRFSATDLVAMGLSDSPTQVEASFAASSSDTATIALAIERSGASRIALDMTVRADNVRGLLDSDWAKMVILDRLWSVSDQGFVSARNRWCATRMGVSRDGYVDRHLAAIKRGMATIGATPTSELESAYRRYAARGGEITWHSRPTLTTPVGQLARFTVAEQLRILNATLESVRGRAAPFRFQFAPVVPVAPTALATSGDPALPINPALTAAGGTAASAPALDASLAPATGVAAMGPSAPGTETGLAGVAPPGSGGAPVQSRSGDDPTRTEVPPPVVTRVPVPAKVPLPITDTAARGPTTVGQDPARGIGVRPAGDPAAQAPAARPTIARVTPRPSVAVVTSPGRRLLYGELSQLEGSRIEIRSSYGITRRGTLEKYTDTAITVRLEQRERGMSVTMPQQTVSEIRLLDYRATAGDTPTGG
jgi:hypothetical protein